MVAPLIVKIVAFSLAKKIVVILVARLYGFPRLYRRASEFNHYVNRDNPKRKEKVQNRLQFLFRLPSRIFQNVQRWRGVQEPPSPPPGLSHGTTHNNLQQKQVREIHTRASAGRVPSASVAHPLFIGFPSVSQSLRIHLLGWRGAGNQTSRLTRPFSVSYALLPFGISSLMLPNKELQASSKHFISPKSHPFHVRPVSQSTSLGTTPDIEHLIQGCASHGFLGWMTQETPKECGPIPRFERMQRNMKTTLEVYSSLM